MVELKFGDLLPVIAQDYRTGEVRMLAWANEEALKRTLKTGYAHYYSRTREKIWKKGESSGELQRVLEVRVDCDGDALLYVVEQEKNRACHTGERNCFFRDVEGERVSRPMPFETLARLQEIIEDRLREKPDTSYTAKLASQGIDRVIQKFGEEAVETLLALKGGDKKEVIREVADMLYTLVLALTLEGVKIEEVMKELARRMG
ncbi:MAG TPA: bifunctional phosphoribosyl-AMP cyclohydrolase/phosphoribosyl-ATP diphosphatase HisIE [Aquificaceae bacterium]|nr:bifunctional phosphoribosyl-AMP cyclohydrolase/phosphoribosyl-ATP diphosphatase HisIE [Aquificaceae bacterium]